MRALHGPALGRLVSRVAWSGILAGHAVLAGAQPAALSPEQALDFAGRVANAWANEQVMPQLSAVHPEATVEDGYAVQAAFVERAFAATGIGGYKAAIVGQGGQDNLGIDGPLTAVVPGDGILRAADGVTVYLEDFPNRHVETEIGYQVAAPISAPVASVAELRDRVSGIAAVIELPGGATESTQPGTAADLLAWNINAKELIVGAWHDPADIDADAIAITLTRDGESINAAKGGQAAGGQWETLRKTINTLVGQGYVVEPDHVITNGALGKIVEAETGRYEAEYGPLGAIAFRVEAAR